MSPLKKYQRTEEYERIESTLDTMKIVLLLGLVLLVFLL